MSIGETVLDLVRQCEHNLLAHGRPFEATLCAGATADELVAAETALGLALPQSLRTFLATFNGMELTSYSADIHERPEGLFVYSLDELRRHSDRMYELLCIEDFAPRGPGASLAYCLVPGGYIDGEIVLRSDACDAEHHFEPPARERVELHEDCGLIVAESFTDWLKRSLISMAQTSGGLQIFCADNFVVVVVALPAIELHSATSRSPQSLRVSVRVDHA